MAMFATQIDTDQTQTRLSAEEVERFHRDGFLGPFAMYTPEQMAALRPEVERILETDPQGHKLRHHNRHLDEPLIREFASHPAVVNRMTGILGPDLLLWRTNFFVKRTGSKEIPWHQDYNYWPIEPAIICSAWLAVDESTRENGCVQILPGSHRKILPHVKATDDMAFSEMAETHGLDLDKRVYLEMKPGEFILFNERTLHHSEANHSAKRRIGLAIRVIVPIVRVMDLDAPGHRMLVLSGEDRMGFNPLAE